MTTQITPARFDAIEGLRGWLAWPVVALHVSQAVGLERTPVFGEIMRLGGTESVRLFIIISGFAIASLTLARQESWPRYITRRAFRLFPLYLVALAAGAVTMYLALAAFPHLPWGNAPDYTYALHQREAIASVEAAPLQHALLHLTLLQGVVGSNFLDYSQTSILGPAWSLSLEWQFYLIAPALIWMLRQRTYQIVAIILLMCAVAAFRVGVFGEFVLPSLFAGSAQYFLIGIVSRLSIDRVRGLNLPLAASALCLVGLGILFHAAFSVAVWLAFLVFLAHDGASRHWADALARKAGHIAFSSKPAMALGARSYATYLLHWPILQTLLFVLVAQLSLTKVQALGVLGVSTALLTLLCADIAYRGLERPFIKIGARIAGAKPKPSAAKSAGPLQPTLS